MFSEDDYMKNENHKIKIENRQFDFNLLYQDERAEETIAPLHYHRYTEYILCVEDGIEFTINSKKISPDTKDIIVIGANVIHSSYKPSKSKGKQYVFRIPQNLLSGMINNTNYKKSINKFETLFMPYNYYIIKDDKLYSELLEIFQNIYIAINKETNHTLYIYSQILMIADTFLKYQTSIPSKNTSLSKGNETNIQITADYMQQHFNKKIAMEDMAKMAHMSYSYYPKMFKKTMGVSFSNFLISLRISAAEELMLAGKYTMNEIAEKSGFPSQSTFNHTYKKLRGFSPRDFKKS